MPRCARCLGQIAHGESVTPGWYAPPMSDDRPVLLFGESYHHPDILYRTGFLVPDPVVVVDRGGGHRALDERARRRPGPQGSLGGRGSQHRRAGYPRAARRRQRVRRLGGACGGGVPRARTERDRRRRRLPRCARRSPSPQRRRCAPANRHLSAAPPDQDAAGGGMDHLDGERRHGCAPERDRPHLAAEIRDGLLMHEGRNLTSADLIYAVESHLLRERQQHRRTRSAAAAPSSADPHRTESDVIRAGSRSCSTSIPSTRRPATGAT